LRTLKYDKNTHWVKWEKSCREQKETLCSSFYNFFLHIFQLFRILLMMTAKRMAKSCKNVLLLLILLFIVIIVVVLICIYVTENGKRKWIFEMCAEILRWKIIINNFVSSSSSGCMEGKFIVHKEEIFRKNKNHKHTYTHVSENVVLCVNVDGIFWDMKLVLRLFRNKIAL
jgi:hypothetical protein